MKDCAVEIEISGRLPARMGLGKAELRSAAAYFARRSAARSRLLFRSVAVVIQDDAASAEVHESIMGVQGATDVITQRYDAIPPEPEGVYGELYVNAQRALAAAPKRHGWSSAKEFLLYVAHGMDHLSGADDHSPRDYALMRRRELAWLRDLERAAGAAP